MLQRQDSLAEKEPATDAITEWGAAAALAFLGLFVALPLVLLAAFSVAFELGFISQQWIWS